MSNHASTPLTSRRSPPWNLWFSLGIGGYGLFGVIYSVKLRLVPRRKLQRVVDFLGIEEVMPAFTRRIEDGFLYGDF